MLRTYSLPLSSDWRILPVDGPAVVELIPPARGILGRLFGRRPILISVGDGSTPNEDEIIELVEPLRLEIDTADAILARAPFGAAISVISKQGV